MMLFAFTIKIVLLVCRIQECSNKLTVKLKCTKNKFH